MVADHKLWEQNGFLGDLIINHFSLYGGIFFFFTANINKGLMMKNIAVGRFQRWRWSLQLTKINNSVLWWSPPPRIYRAPQAKSCEKKSVCLFSPFIVMLIIRNWRRFILVCMEFEGFFFCPPSFSSSPFIISSLKIEQKKKACWLIHRTIIKIQSLISAHLSFATVVMM